MIPTRTLAAASLALLAVLAAPAPAFAEPYPPGMGASVVTANCSSTYHAGSGYFAPGETITIEITADTAAAQDVVASVTTHTAAADGSLVVPLPKASVVASQYELWTSGTISSTRGPLLYSPTENCTGVSSGSSGQTPGTGSHNASQNQLPDTGADLSWLWLSGGLIFTGLLALGAVQLVRRRSA